MKSCENSKIFKRPHTTPLWRNKQKITLRTSAPVVRRYLSACYFRRLPADSFRSADLCATALLVGGGLWRHRSRWSASARKCKVVCNRRDFSSSSRGLRGVLFAVDWISSSRSSTASLWNNPNKFQANC